MLCYVISRVGWCRWRWWFSQVVTGIADWARRDYISLFFSYIQISFFYIISWWHATRGQSTVYSWIALVHFHPSTEQKKKLSHHQHEVLLKKKKKEKSPIDVGNPIISVTLVIISIINWINITNNIMPIISHVSVRMRLSAGLSITQTASPIIDV